MLQVQVSSAASKYIAYLAGNANKQGRTSDEICPCGNSRFDHLKKLQGHLFQPLLALMNRTGLPLPPTWNAKARCSPAPGDILNAISSSFSELADRLTKRLEGSIPEGVLPPFWDPEIPSRALEIWNASFAATPSES